MLKLAQEQVDLLKSNDLTSRTDALKVVTDLLNGTPGSGSTTANIGTIPETACAAGGGSVVLCDGSAAT